MRRAPSTTAPQCESGVDPVSSSGTRTKFSARTVLIVDDCEDNRELFATVLRGAGFVVSTANDGVDALEITARERPSVILLDLAMPQMDGFATLEALRREPHGIEAYVIVVSALGDRATRARIEHLGADDFLQKPCTPRELVARVAAAVDALEAPRAAAG